MKDLYVRFTDGRVVKNPQIGTRLWRLVVADNGTTTIVIVAAEAVRVRAKLVERVPQFEFIEAMQPLGKFTFTDGAASPVYDAVGGRIAILGGLDPSLLFAGNVIPLDDVDTNANLIGFDHAPVTKEEPMPVEVAEVEPEPESEDTFDDESDD